jgi:cation diffusion facilitator family transporter
MTGIGVFELIVALITGSFSLLGDAVDSFSDSATSLIIWLGLRASKRGPDGKYHFGHFRAETLYSMFGAILMTGIGMVILYQSYTSLHVVRELKYGPLAIGTVLVAATISTAMLAYKIRAARKLKLLSMKTEVINSAVDSVTSIAALIGVTLATQLGLIQIDSASGIVISVFIVASSYLIVREASLVLMDACGCQDIREVLKETVLLVPGVKGVRNIRLRKLGSYIAGDIHALVDDEMTLREANEISRNIEDRAKELFDEIHEIIVKLEPFEEHSKVDTVTAADGQEIPEP